MNRIIQIVLPLVGLLTLALVGCHDAPKRIRSIRCPAAKGEITIDGNGSE